MIEEKLRDEFKKDFFVGGKFADMPEWEAEQIADWWLSKFKEFHKEILEKKTKTLTKKLSKTMNEWAGKKYKDLRGKKKENVVKGWAVISNGKIGTIGMYNQPEITLLGEFMAKEMRARGIYVIGKRYEPKIVPCTITYNLPLK